jgi:tripartite-type tricarboxylate transporter receptor subunit TctC
MAPEVPADRVQAMRQAFMSVMEDKEFKADAQKAQLDLDPMPGTQVEKLIKDLFGMPEAIKARLKKVNENKS